MSWLFRSLLGGWGRSTAPDSDAAASASSASPDRSGSSEPTDLSTLTDEYTISYRGPCNVYLYHFDRAPELKSPSATVFLLRSLSDSYSCFLHLYSSDSRKLLVQPINSQFLPRVQSPQKLSFSLYIDRQTRFFQLEFPSSDHLDQFLYQWFIAHWEHARQENIKKSMKEDEIQHAFRSFAALEDAEMKDDVVDDDRVPMDDMDFDQVKTIRNSTGKSIPFTSPGKAKRSGDEDKEDDDEDDEDDGGSSGDEDAFGTPEKPRSSIVRSTPGDSQARGRKQQKYLEQNDNLAVGITSLNRTFVGRGAQIGVFRHDSDGSLDFLTHIPAVKTVKGDLLTPSRMMLHEADRKMVLLNPEDQERAYLFDIEAEKIISEFGGPEDFKIRNIAPVTKYAEASDEATFLGVNNVSVFRMDPRRSEKNKIAVKGDQITPLSTCVTATGEGNVAVGSQKGEIRLYNDISKRAKSLLPGLGDPIIGIDVTENGRYLLATTKTYLLLITTQYEEGHKSGFKQSMATKGIPPVKLQISPADMIQFNIAEVSFTEAHFDTGDNIEERWIVASTGPFIITWNMRRVLKGKMEYKIKKCASNVVADSFLFNHQDQIVAALPDDVMVEQRKIKPRQTK